MVFQQEKACILDLESQTPHPSFLAGVGAASGGALAAADGPVAKWASGDKKQRVPVSEDGFDVSEMDVATEFTQEEPDVEPQPVLPLDSQAEAQGMSSVDADLEQPRRPDCNGEDAPLLSSERIAYFQAHQPLIDSQACTPRGVKPHTDHAPATPMRSDCVRRLVWVLAVSVVFLGVAFLGLTSYFNADIELKRFKRSSEEKMLELEQKIKVTTHGKLPKIRDIRTNPVTESTLRDEMKGAWCEAVQLDPHYGVIDLSDVCPSDLPDIRVDDDSFPNVSPERNREQFAEVTSYLNWHPLNSDTQHFQEALTALESLSQFRAQDIFAFRETWSDEDTEVLRKLDPTAWAWAPGNLTTDKLKAKLPTIGDLRELVNADRVAIVGGADSLSGAGLGPEIDSHPHVVRFNEIVGDKLIANETGSRTTFHVSCSKVAPLGQSGVAEFDLETDTVWRTWCGRMHASGEFADVTERPFLIRPSAYCVLSEHGAKMWTRGFLFYWFIGRLFRHVNMYGFSGSGHYHNNAPIWEKYLDFEHLFYEVNGLNVH